MALAELYPQIKSAHVALVVVSGSLFALRGYFPVAAAQGAARRVVDVIKQGPKPGVTIGPAAFASQFQARYQA